MRAFIPHSLVKCMAKKSPHIASLTPPTLSLPFLPPLSHTQSEIAALQPAPPQKWKWMLSPPVVGAEQESGKGRGRGRKRSKRHGNRSGRWVSKTGFTLTLIVCITENLTGACAWQNTGKLSSSCAADYRHDVLVSYFAINPISVRSHKIPE